RRFRSQTSRIEAGFTTSRAISGLPCSLKSAKICALTSRNLEAGRMTRTRMLMKPFPQWGLLTSAEEHEKAVVAWQEENKLAELETLLKSAEKLGLPVPDKELAALSPGLLGWLG